MTQRQFKGIWIPAEIWLDRNLSAVDKILLSDIDSFTGNQKTFYKSNETIAEELYISVRSASRSIKKLKDLGYIRIEGNKRSRLIYSTFDLYDKGQNEQDESNIVYDIGQNDLSERSKSLPTNTDTNSITKSSTKKGRPSSLHEVKDYFIEIDSSVEEAEKFVDWYDSVGWKVKGGNLVKDWKACARRWTRTNKKANEKRNKTDFDFDYYTKYNKTL